MRRLSWLILLFLILLTTARADYESLNLINRANWGRFVDDLIMPLPPSQGALNFTPVDIKLLCRLLPAGTPLTIKPYRLPNKPSLNPAKVPYLVSQVRSRADLDQIFSAQSTEVIVYPSLNRLIIYVNQLPFAQVVVQAGPAESRRQVKGVNDFISWESVIAAPTPVGQFTVLGSANNYLSGSYYRQSVIPFGAWLVRQQNNWVYQYGERWYQAPPWVLSDLSLPPAQRQFKYFDLAVDGRALRWGENPFGADILYWGNASSYGYPFLAYAPGELALTEKLLVKDLVDLLTLPGPDDFDYCVGNNRDFQLLPTVALPQFAPQIVAAVKLKRDNRLPRSFPARQEILGLADYYLIQEQWLERYHHWYRAIRKDWDFFRLLRSQLRSDFSAMGVYSQENRQNILENWLNNRLAFDLATPPAEAKYVQQLNFSDFFRPSEKPSVFSAREKEFMQQVIRQAIQGETSSLNLHSVAALNDYNFGRILNDILGNLYRSHGCLHVSPRHSYFLFEILPLKTPIRIYPYSRAISPEAFSDIPQLSDLVNFQSDLELLKTQLSGTAEVTIDVYTDTGIWVLYLDRRPLARLDVKGGPRKAMYQVINRDSQGRPVFDKNMAYPTTPGYFQVWRKTTDYLSGLYRDTTLVPQGGKIKKELGSWLYQDKTGSWRPLPASLAVDLAKPTEVREYTFYDEKTNASGEVVEVSWGSQPFGKYVVQMSANGKTPVPEIIHSSGDLIMEERQLINDLIQIMAAPNDDFDKCVDENSNFSYYRACYEFVKEGKQTELLDEKLLAYYKLYYGLPLSSFEAGRLPLDSIAADKMIRGGRLSEQEKQALLQAGVARQVKKTLIYDQPKLQGLRYDTYQYVVMMEKYAHHYATLKRYWPELHPLRWAMLEDFNNFVLKDPQLFYAFMRELMLGRIRLEQLSQLGALKRLDELINQSSD